MIKSVNQLVTLRCHSKCFMCNIWKERNFRSEMCADDYKKLYSLPEFSEMEDITISGGEPTEKFDLFEIVHAILASNSKSKSLFFCTNGTNQKKTLEFVSEFSSHVKEIFVCISIEGTPDIHNKIRGIKCYDTAVQTLDALKELEYQNLQTIISSTILPENGNKECLDHLHDLAEKTKSNHSFRLAAQSEIFYQNHETPISKIRLSAEQIKFMGEYIHNHYWKNPFMKIQYDFIINKKSFLGTKENLKCLAGNISVFIKPDGKIYPCINSKRIIGNKNGINNIPYKLGRMESCPCCTECQVYPMLNFSQYKT